MPLRRAGVLLLGCLLLSRGGHAETPVFAVASNMTQVMTELAGAYESRTGIHVSLSFGSSGNITRKIMQGAPYSLFLSADHRYTEMLREGGHYRETGRPFARGQLCAYLPRTSRLDGVSGFDRLLNELSFNRYRRLALANPDIAPYGQAARQALQGAGLWTVDPSRILLGENVAQAAQYALAGGVDVAFIACSFDREPRFTRKGTFVSIPADLYRPLDQYLLLLSGAGPESTGFYTWLLSAAPAPTIRRFGYIPLQSD